MCPHSLQQEIGQQAINKCADTQRHDVDARVRIQVVEFQDLLSGRDGAFAVREPLAGVAGEGDAAQGVGYEVADGVADRGEVVDALEEAGHVDGEDAGHELGDGEEDGGEVYGETGVCEQGIKLFTS